MTVLNAWKLNKKEAQRSIYNTKTQKINEYPDFLKLKSFLKNSMGIEFSKTHPQAKHFENELEQIQKYFNFKFNKKEGKIQTKLNFPLHRWGRCNPVDYLSLSVFHRPTRHAFCTDEYVDIDIVNSSQCLLLEICKKNSHSVPKLQEYCDNRELILNDIMNHHKCTREIAKKLFIRLSFGGNYDTWLNDFKIENANDKMDFLVALEKEYEIVMNLVFDNNKIIIDDVEKANPLKYDKYATEEGRQDAKKRTCMSLWYQTLERHLQEEMIRFLVEVKHFKLEDIIPCQDGFMILKVLNYPELISDCQKILQVKFGLNIKLIEKPFDEAMDIPLLESFDIDDESDDSKYRQVADDNAAAKLIFKELRKSLIYTRNRLFYKHNHIWIENSSAIDDYVLKHILSSNITKLNPDNKYIPYNQNIKCAKNVREVLYVLIRTQDENIDIYDKFHTTTRNRLCFEDGVLDFKTKTFYEWKDIENECFSTVMIKRKFKSYFYNPNKKLINDIKKKLFEPLFGKDTTKALNFLSRALSGNYEDKNWASYLGNRDCGKGVLYDALEAAFKDYIKTFELGNIMYQRNTPPDLNETARKLYWLLDYEFVRLAVSQETPAPEENLKVRGKILKKLAGGGDTHVARRNYDRTDTHFKIDSTFLFMGNNALNVDCADAFEHHIPFHSVCQFKSQNEIDRMREEGTNELILQSYKIKDPSIKSDCMTDEWKNAIIYLVYQNYINDAIPVINEDVDDDPTTKSVRQKILTNYEITQNPNDCIVCDDVFKRLNDCKKKIKNEFESMGIEKKVSNKGDTRKQTCFFGIRLIATIPDPPAYQADVNIDSEKKENKNDDDEELEEKDFNGKKYYISNKNRLVYDVDEDDNPDIEVGQIINGIINLY